LPKGAGGAACTFSTAGRAITLVTKAAEAKNTGAKCIVLNFSDVVELRERVGCRWYLISISNLPYVKVPNIFLVGSSLMS
jgi:hypothetical protein